LGKKTAVKVYHAEEALQLFDILRGWAKFNFGGVIDRRGRSYRRNRVAKNLLGRGCKNAFVKFSGETIGGQSCEKSLQMAEMCLPV
jgi:hypothetical protein